MFQHSAARRRLAVSDEMFEQLKVSTLSRPKAAGASLATCIRLLQVSTLSRPKAAADIHTKP